MSSQANVITRFKGFLHDIGANTTDTKDSIDNVFVSHTALVLGPGLDGTAANFANGTVHFCTGVDRKLMAVKLVCPGAVTNVAGDDIIITVVTNGATVVTYNTNSSANGSANIAANSVTDLGINTVNSFCNANTFGRVTWTQADKANNSLLNASFILVFAPL